MSRSRFNYRQTAHTLADHARVLRYIPLTKSRKQGGKAMPSSRTISANGIEIFLREQGEGPLGLPRLRSSVTSA
jgi:hypothetical protein